MTKEKIWYYYFPVKMNVLSGFFYVEKSLFNILLLIQFLPFLDILHLNYLRWS